MEGSQSPERSDAARGDGDRGSVRNGVRVDGIWQHQPVCDDTSGRESVRTREFSLRASTILFVLDGFVAPIVERRCKGLDLHARSGDDPRRSQGGMS